MNNFLPIEKPPLSALLRVYGIIGILIVGGIVLVVKKGKLKKIFGIILIAIGIYIAYMFYAQSVYLKHIET